MNEQNAPNKTLLTDGERGQSFTEMAISMVFILVLLAGIVDLGRAFYTFVALRDAAQEAAAYASFCPADLAGIEQRARQTSTKPIDLGDTTNILVVCVYDSFSPLECSNPATSPSFGDGVSITVKAPFFKLSMPFLGGVTLPLYATASDTIVSTSNNVCP